MSANAFERHNIRHLSASSVNLWNMQPAAWICEKLLLKPLGVGRAAHRGIAAEKGVAEGLLDPKKDVEECVKVALDHYDFFVERRFEADKEREAIPGIVETALAELRPYGPAVKTQQPVEWRCDGIDVPFIGFVDFCWDRHGILIDLKTQLRLASDIKAGHARQVALYCTGKLANMDARLAYVTPKACAVYGLEDPRAHLACLRRIALSLGRFLALSDDKEELAQLVTPDLDHFLWNTPAARETAWKIWEI